MARVSSEHSISTTATQAQILQPDAGHRSPAPATSSSELPPDLVDTSARRVGLLAAAVMTVAVIEAVASHGYEYLHDADYPQRADRLDLVGVAIMVLVSGAMWIVVRRRWATNKSS